MVNLRTEAEVLAIGVETGMNGVEEVIAWADARLMATDELPSELIDISMASKAHPLDIVHALRLIPGAVDVATASRCLIARMGAEFAAGRVTASHLVRGLYQMFLSNQLPDDDSAEDMSRLDDAFDFARQGYCRQEEAELALNDFLRRHRAAPGDD